MAKSSYWISDDSKSHYGDPPQLADSTTLGVEGDLLAASDAFVKANDAYAKDIITCGITVKQAYIAFTKQVEKWNALMKKKFSNPKSSSSSGRPLPTSNGGSWDFTFGGTIDGTAGRFTTSTISWHAAQYAKMPWPLFTERLNKYFGQMQGKMDLLPEEAEMTRINAGGTEDEKSALFETIVKANHGNARSFLKMGSGGSGKGSFDSILHGTPAAELCADPTDFIPENYTYGPGANYHVRAWHPSQWFKDSFKEVNATFVYDKNPGSAGGKNTGGQLNALSEGATDGTGDDKFWCNRPSLAEAEGVTFGDMWYNYKPEWMLKWNCYSSLPNRVFWTGDSDPRSGVTLPKHHQWGDTTDATDVDYRNKSPGTSAKTSERTLIGNTFFMGTLRNPEIMQWWLHNDAYGGDTAGGATRDKAFRWIRYASFIATDWSSDHEISLGDTTWQWQMREDGSSFERNPHWSSVDVDPAERFNRARIRTRQSMGVTDETATQPVNVPHEWTQGYDHGGFIGANPIDELMQGYKALKLAAITLRDKSHCALELDVKLYVATADYKQIAATYAEDPLISDKERALAQEHLDKITAAEGEILQNTSAYTKNLIFREQCFLLANIHALASWKKGLDAQRVAAADGGTRAYKPAPYLESSVNSSIMIDADPYGYFNKLTNNASDKYLFDANNWDISTLQPKISLYKIEFDEKTGKEDEIKIIFDSFANADTVSDILTNKKRRGFGVGIQNFQFSYEGSNPFSAKKSIKAKLAIFANSFDELLDERGTGGNKWRYVDLALKTSNKGRSKTNRCYNSGLRYENQELAKLNFRLKAVVGWALPPGGSGHLSPGVKTALYDSFVTLNLTPTVHDFQFDEQGRVVFEINYLAYVDDFFDQKLYNIFTDVEISKKQISRELTYKNHRRMCKREEIKILKRDSQKDISEEKRTSVSHLVNSMMLRDVIYYIDMDYDEIRNFMSKGPFYEISEPIVPQTSDERTNNNELDVEAALSPYLEKNPGEELNQGAIRAALTVNNPNKADVPFFYLGDLVDTILDNMTGYFEDMSAWAKSIPTDSDFGGLPVEDPLNPCDLTNKANEIKRAAAEFKKFRVLLGPLELVSRTDDLKTSNINMGDLPISVKYFIEFLTDKLTKKEESIYTLANFLNNLFNSLVRNFLNDDTCFTTNVKQKINVNQSVVSSYRGGGKRGEFDEITQLAQKGRIGLPQLQRRAIAAKKNSILNISGIAGQNDGGNLGFDKQINYLSFYAGRVRPMEKMTGTRSTDEDAGIMHYVLGKDRGIIKNISLSKTQTPGLQEVRFEQEGYDGLQQLRVVYDVDIDTYAFVKTFPGTYIFVNPQSFAPTTNLTACDPLNLTQYGIGGYYMIIRSEHDFGPGVANTKITAKWVNEVDSKGQGKKDCGEGGIHNVQKCKGK